MAFHQCEFSCVAGTLPIQSWCSHKSYKLCLEHPRETLCGASTFLPCLRNKNCISRMNTVFHSYELTENAALMHLGLLSCIHKPGRHKYHLLWKEKYDKKILPNSNVSLCDLEDTEWKATRRILLARPSSSKTCHLAPCSTTPSTTRVAHQ